MAFEAAPIGCEKTVLSDLQRAWQNLRAEVAEQAASMLIQGRYSAENSSGTEIIPACLKVRDSTGPAIR